MLAQGANVTVSITGIMGKVSGFVSARSPSRSSPHCLGTDPGRPPHGPFGVFSFAGPSRPVPLNGKQKYG